MFLAKFHHNNHLTTEITYMITNSQQNINIDIHVYMCVLYTLKYA